jgi:hypothetical protein
MLTKSQTKATSLPSQLMKPGEIQESVYLMVCFRVHLDIVSPVHLHAILVVGNFTKVARMCADHL